MNLTKADVMAVVNHPSTSMAILQTLATRLALPALPSAPVLVARITTTLASMADTAITPILDTDLGFVDPSVATSLPASPQVVAPVQTIDVRAELVRLLKSGDRTVQDLVDELIKAELKHLLDRDTSFRGVFTKLVEETQALWRARVETLETTLKAETAARERLETALATEKREREALANHMAQYAEVTDESIEALKTPKMGDDDAAKKKRRKYLTKEYWLGKTGDKS